MPAYVINGNVRDLVDNQLTIEGHLTKMFLQPVQGRQHFDLIVVYDRATGIRFTHDGMEQKFREASGLTVAASRPADTAGVFGNQPAGAASLMPRDPPGRFLW